MEGVGFSGQGGIREGRCRFTLRQRRTLPRRVFHFQHGVSSALRGLGMGVGSGEGLGHERQDGRYPPRSVGEVLDLVRLQIPTQNSALPIRQPLFEDLVATELVVPDSFRTLRQ